MIDSDSCQESVISNFYLTDSAHISSGPLIFREFTTRWKRASKEGRLYPVSKRVFDVIFILLWVPFVVPFCALIAVVIKLDSAGPVFFRQTRVGYNGRRFDMLKFRTMVSNASELKEGLMHLNEHSGHDFKISDDPRTTRVGKLLRRTSMDELPQLWNVLLGEMSLIGPRACSIPVEKYDPEQVSRLTVPAGIAGLAQVFARDQEFDARCHYDTWYVRNRSLTLDLYLLFATVVLLLARPNGK